MLISLCKFVVVEGDMLDGRKKNSLTTYSLILGRKFGIKSSTTSFKSLLLNACSRLFFLIVVSVFTLSFSPLRCFSEILAVPSAFTLTPSSNNNLEFLICTIKSPSTVSFPLLMSTTGALDENNRS